MNSIASLLVPFALLGNVSGETPAAGATDLLANPSFEAGAAEPDGWTTWQPAGTALSRDPAGGRAGSAAGRIEIAGSGAAGYPAFKAAVRGARPGEIHVGRAWARTRGFAGLGPYVVIEYLDGDGRRIEFAQGDYAGPDARDWKELEVTGIAPAGTVSLTLALVAHGTGAAWFDDARLVRAAAAPAEFGGDRVDLKIRRDRVVLDRLIGFGAQGDFFLTVPSNTSHGVGEEDVALVLRRVEAMRPHIIRLFFSYRWWEPEEGRRTPESPEIRDLVRWARFLRGIGTAIILNPWGDHFAYGEWMRPGGTKLPAPEKREAAVRSLADFLAYLRRDEGLDNVKYLALLNEPDNDGLRPVPPEEYVRLHGVLDRVLRERGLRGEVSIIGVDDAGGGPAEASPWFRQVLAVGGDPFDAISTHTYKHRYVPGLVPWIRARLEILRAARPGAPRRPLFITEIGYGGETYTNSENGTFEYGLFLADAATTAVREGAAAVLPWCLLDTYYGDRRQEWGLWRYKDAGWAPRPGFHAWSLITRWTRPGSRAVAVDGLPEAPDLRAVALESPEGRWTVLLVNRHRRALDLSLDPGLERDAAFRLFLYDRASQSGAGSEMLGPREEIRAAPGRPAAVRIPAESFILLTEER